MKTQNLDKLRRLAEALLEQEQARLREIRRRQDATEAKISNLNTAIARQREVISAELEMPVAGPVFDRWGAWTDRRRMALNSELAQERVAWEEQRQTTLFNFGRAEALKQIEAKEKFEERRIARRKLAKKGIRNS